MNRTPFAYVLLVTLTVLVGSCSSGGCVDTPLSPCDGEEPAAVATTVTLSPTSASFSSLGESQQLGATVTDQRGRTMAGASVTWSSSLASVASVSSTGLVTAVSNGAATISATAGTASGTAAVDVSATVVLLPSQLCIDHSASAIATFVDDNLESTVRAALGIAAQDDLTCGLAASLTELDASNLGISNITGIQNLTGLTTFLFLTDNSITDVSPLANLTSLLTLDMGGNSDLRDISSLSMLTSLDHLALTNDRVASISAVSSMASLTQLFLGGNVITDVSPLSGLTSLDLLRLAGNNVADISPLSGLTNLLDLDLGATGRADLTALSALTELQFLFLNDNSLTDVGPLQGMTRLAYVDLNRNPGLSDIQPLLDNTGLGSSDEVLLSGTAVDCTDVTALMDNGVTVASDCAFISNLAMPLIELNSPSCSVNNGSLFTISFDYTDSNADVTSTGSVVNWFWVNQPSGMTGTFPPGATYTGTPSAGTISWGVCFRFGTDPSLDITVSLTDDGGLTSNSLTINVPQPVGANLSSGAGMSVSSASPAGGRGRSDGMD